MSDTTLVLGPFTFGGLEKPTAMPFGGEQRTVAHELIGGGRTIDAMGRSDRPIEWSGWLLGADAVNRAQQLDALRIAGAKLNLTWDKFNYDVIVRNFLADYQRFYQIAYRITCEVIADNTQPVGAPAATPIDQALNSDAALAALQAQAIADQQLAALTQAVQIAVNAVTSFATAPRATINSITQTVLAAQTQVGVLIGQTTEAIGTPSSFGGIVSGSGGSASAAALSAQTSQVFELNDLNNIQGTLGRISANLASANSSPNTIAVAGGNLYQLAEKQYGDATAWTAIARANGLTDPFVQGSQILTIPPQSDQSGGILNA
jgi:nucleoid-associated protein YgaU